MLISLTGLLLALLSPSLPRHNISLPQQETNAPIARQVSPTGIKHGVLCLGAETFILDGEGKTVWSDPRPTRDGWMLPNGNLLLVITKSADYPGGGVVEINREGKTFFEYRGTQSEVDTVQPLPNNRYLVTESGPKPRLMELDRKGKILREFPLQCQTNDFHMETRMARKLRNGNYLVPHLLDFAVREYDRTGKVVSEIKTPNWPFLALRLDNGETFITCTWGNTAIQTDKTGKIIWQITNEDLPGAPLRDVCGAQRLPNGNTVLESYGAGGADDIKLLEITPDKKIVWTLYTNRPHGVHQFQILAPDATFLKERLQR